MSIKDRLMNRFMAKQENKIRLAEQQTKLTVFKETQNISTNNTAVIQKVETGEGGYEIVEKEILPAEIICPDCKGVTLEGLDFCDKCGGILNPMG